MAGLSNCFLLVAMAQTSNLVLITADVPAYDPRDPSPYALFSKAQACREWEKV
jgi:hypothetical protein